MKRELIKNLNILIPNLRSQYPKEEKLILLQSFRFLGMGVVELCTNKVLLLMNSVLSKKLKIKRIQKLGNIQTKP